MANVPWNEERPWRGGGGADRSLTGDDVSRIASQETEKLFRRARERGGVEG